MQVFTIRPATLMKHLQITRLAKSCGVVFCLVYYGLSAFANETEHFSVPPGQRASAHDTGEFILNGMKANRELLRTGHVSIKGRFESFEGLTINQKLLHEKREAIEARLSTETFQKFERAVSKRRKLPPDFEISCTFDFNNERVRFDRFEEGREGRYIRAANVGMVQVLTNGNSTGTVNKIPRDRFPGRAVRPIDIREIGLYSFVDFMKSNRRTSLDDSVRHREIWQTWDVDSVEYDGHVYTAAFSNLNGKLIHKLQVDADRGMSPIEFSHWESGHQIYHTETAWTVVNGLTLPSVCIMTDYQANQILKLELSWDQINEPLTENVFNLDSLSLPKGTLVVDNRLEDKPIIESVIGADTEVVSVGGSLSVARTIAIILNSVLIIVIALIVLYRRFRPVV
jgi:hypothetical protein